MPRPSDSPEAQLAAEAHRIVHAYTQVRKVVVQDYTEYWRLKVRAVYRFPGVE